jgi:hypothetical protein
LAFGAIQAASPLALRWLDQATVQALLLALIAAVYIGFAVADGRPTVIAVERSHYVAGTRWWPPFCAAVDWLVAVVLAIEIIAGAGFHH